MDRLITILLLVSAVMTIYYAFFDQAKVFVG
jgi:hypothetical protein